MACGLASIGTKQIEREVSLLVRFRSKADKGCRLALMARGAIDPKRAATLR
jgi:hypothetical protein